MFIFRNVIFSLFHFVLQQSISDMNARWSEIPGVEKNLIWTMPHSYFEWLQGFFIVHSSISSTVYTPCLWTVWSTVYAKPRWQISGPTGIRAWYLQVTSPVQSIRMSHRGRPPWLMLKLNPIAMLVGTPMEYLKIKSLALHTHPSLRTI